MTAGMAYRPARPRPGPRRPATRGRLAGQLAVAGAAADGLGPRRAAGRERSLGGRVAGRPRGRRVPGAQHAAGAARSVGRRRPGRPGRGEGAGRAQTTPRRHRPATCNGCTTSPTTRWSWSSAARSSRSGHRRHHLDSRGVPRRARARRGAGVADRNRLESGRWQRCQPRVRIPPPLPGSSGRRPQNNGSVRRGSGRAADSCSARRARRPPRTGRAPGRPGSAGSPTIRPITRP